MSITMPEAIVSCALLLAVALVATAGVIVNHLEAWLKQPEKTAHWVDDMYGVWYECSACGEGLDFRAMYCPHCGRLMREE